MNADIENDEVHRKNLSAESEISNKVRPLALPLIRSIHAQRHPRSQYTHLRVSSSLPVGADVESGRVSSGTNLCFHALFRVALQHGAFSFVISLPPSITRP